MLLPVILTVCVLPDCIAVIMIHRKDAGREEFVNKGEIMISQTVSDPEMVELNPANDDYYHVVYKPKGSVFICHK